MQTYLSASPKILDLIQFNISMLYEHADQFPKIAFMQLMNIGHIQLTAMLKYYTVQHTVLVNFCCISIFSASHTDTYTHVKTGERHLRHTQNGSCPPLTECVWKCYWNTSMHTRLQNTAVIRCIIATCRKELGECRGLTELTSRALYHCSVKKCDAFLLDFERGRDRKRDIERERWGM